VSVADPASTAAPAPADATPLFETRGLEVHFRLARSKRVVKAIDGVDLQWRRGEVLGIVGESGCGKSTLGRALLGLQPSTGGEILFDGRPLAEANARQLRRRVQLVFQDPYQSLNPRQTVGSLVSEGLAIHGLGRGHDRVLRAVEALHAAGLAPAERFWGRYPHELSGGQRQRVVIASAMALQPEALICDEPVSALDVSVRTQVLQVLVELKQARGLGLIFITHDVGLAWALCDRVAVMYLGRIVEQGTTEQVIGDPQHPYTQALLSVVPTPFPRSDVRRTVLAGELPDASRVPPGCRFHPRCPKAFDRCPSDDPRELLPTQDGDGHGAACWLVDGRPPAASANGEAGAPA
jgi:oligopeptide/dipeptide ABC transporter ATP-binding protein